MSETRELIDQAIAHSDDPIVAREQADVSVWRERIQQARKYDENARKQYAKDRRYARGDSGFKVDDNIVGTNIDILESFMYAKDPDVDILPARSCQPPSAEAIRDAIEIEIEESGGRPPEVAEAGRMAAAQAVLSGMPQQDAMVAGMMAENAAAEELIQSRVDAMQKQYARRLRDTKAFSESLEIVVSRFWRDASLKARGRRFVRSALTVGLGIIKASWQERTAPSPETTTAINDLQANIKRAAGLRAEIDDGDATSTELDAQMAEYQRQLETLRRKPERVTARGFVVDNVAAEDFQVAPGFPIAGFLDAPWVAHRIPMLKVDAKAACNLTEEEAGKLTVYSARKPIMRKTESANLDDDAGPVATLPAEEADNFITNESSPDAGGGGEWVQLWEIWDRDSGTVLTLIEGLNRWAKAAWHPDATTRFYPFMVFGTSEVDGQRHPQSLVSRASKLVDAYNRIASQEEIHRRRIKPKVLFLKGQIGKNAMTTIVDGETAEFVGVETTQPNVNLQTLFFPLTYPQLDPGLYDRSRLIAQIERIFGVQEALSGAINIAKTATEADIQQSGFQARTGGRRDMLDWALQELAQYTAEIARAHLTADDVRRIAGPDAIWPEYSGPRDLDDMVRIEIRAGSTGKPNTAAERQAWAQQLPLLQAGIVQIGQLRNSDPRDVADCLETLLKLTAERSGDRLDIEQLMPKPGQPAAPMGPAPGAPAAVDPSAPQEPVANDMPAEQVPAV